MKYGTTEFYIEKGTFKETPKVRKKVIHLIDTDTNIDYDLGREATRITCTIIAMSRAERDTIKQLLNSTTKTTLEYDDYYYKDVIPGESNPSELISPDGKVWLFDAEFIALDPIPYDLDTDEAKYG